MQFNIKFQKASCLMLREESSHGFENSSKSKITPTLLPLHPVHAPQLHFPHCVLITCGMTVTTIRL